MSSDPYEIFLGRYGSFTAIQTAAFSAIEGGENCIILAPTGSGKTEAAILPIFKRIMEDHGGAGIRAIYVTPLRALNRDLMKRLDGMSKELGISVAVRHGDTTASERQKQAAHPPQVLITTPETLQNLFLSQRLRNSLSNVIAVIVDELHELYSNKRGAQLAVALERLGAVAGEYQRIGISATIGDPEEAKRFLFGHRKGRAIGAGAAKEIRVDVEMPLIPSTERREFREKFDLDLPTLARLERIADIVRQSDSILVFANTRQVVESLGSKLLYLNRISPFGSIGIHHGSLDVKERVEVENAFKEGRVKGIIATSSLELGIDIGSINMVLQYGSPRQVARLVQRVGRGGHRERETSYGKIIVGNYIDALESLAIIGQMGRGSMEKHGMEELAMDVLANQICGMALEYKKIGEDALYRIIHGAAPYKNLAKKDFEKLLSFLAEERLVRIKDGYVGIGSRCREYFFSNISVIPDTVRFFVRDAASNRTISSLDEKFVSNYLDEGTVFITKGLPWRVISMEEGSVFVEPSAEFEAAIPDWEGEDIPVSQDTARGAFELIGRGVAGYYGVLDGSLRKELESFISAQRKRFLPAGGDIVVEELDDYAIIYAALGKLANEFVAKLIGNVASQLSGSRLMTKATPYAIIVDYSGARKKPDIKRVLDTIKNYSAESVLGRDGAIISTELFRYKFIRVCKLFGVVSKKAVITKHDADRLIRFYKDSPIFDEALRDLKKNNIDAETGMRFLGEIRKGAVGISVLEGSLSPLGNEILKASYSYRELLLPALPDDATIKEFGDKIGAKRMELLCTFCSLDFFRNIDIESKEGVACPRCSSPMVCIYGEEKATAVEKRASNKALAEKERGTYREALKEASLVEAYGNRALAALSTYGIGPATAARVLRLLRKDKRQFLIDLLEAQKTFIKTKKYWK